MARRPSGDAWLPLGLTADPVPGNPNRISQEVVNLTSTAGTLQIGAKLTMKKIADLMLEKPEATQKAMRFREKTTAQFKAGLNTGKSIVKIFPHGGDPGITKSMDTLKTLAKECPQATKATEALAQGSRTARWANAASYSGNVGTLGDFLTGKFSGDTYDKWKEDTFHYKLSTAEANVLADIPGDSLFQGFRLASSFMRN